MAFALCFGVWGAWGLPLWCLTPLHVLTVEGYMQVKVMSPLQQWVVIAVPSESVIWNWTIGKKRIV